MLTTFFTNYSFRFKIENIFISTKEFIMKNNIIKTFIIILSSLLVTLLVTVGILIYHHDNETYIERTPQPPPQVTPQLTPDVEEKQPESLPEIIEVISISILLESDEILRGTRFWPEVIVNPENATYKDFELQSDNDLVLRLQGGFFTALDLGRANLTATASNGVTQTVMITVRAPDIESISFDESEITMLPGDMMILTPVILPDEALKYDPINFISDNRSVATVAIDGRVTAVAAGTATIKAEIGDISAEVKVNVIIPARRVNVIMTRRVYSIGDEAKYIIEVDPPNATNASLIVSFTGAAVTPTSENSFKLDEAGEVIVTFTAENGTSISHTLIVHDLKFLADEILRLTNIERVNIGAEPLSSTDLLNTAADIRAKEAIRYWSHTRPDGQRFETVLEETGVHFYRAGENLAAGQRSSEEAVRSWMNSSKGHREALLSFEYGRVGIGVAMDDDGRLYWAQLFID